MSGKKKCKEHLSKICYSDNPVASHFVTSTGMEGRWLTVMCLWHIAHAYIQHVLAPVAPSVVRVH
eukprot:6101816-Ditylum_brightwellii.AAC.1